MQVHVSRCTLCDRGTRYLSVNSVNNVYPVNPIRCSDEYLRTCCHGDERVMESCFSPISCCTGHSHRGGRNARDVSKWWKVWLFEFCMSHSRKKVLFLALPVTERDSQSVCALVRTHRPHPLCLVFVSGTRLQLSFSQEAELFSHRAHTATNYAHFHKCS